MCPVIFIVCNSRLYSQSTSSAGFHCLGLILYHETFWPLNLLIGFFAKRKQNYPSETLSRHWNLHRQVYLRSKRSFFFSREVPYKKQSSQSSRLIVDGSRDSWLQLSGPTFTAIFVARSGRSDDCKDNWTSSQDVGQPQPLQREKVCWIYLDKNNRRSLVDRVRFTAELSTDTSWQISHQ